IGTKFAKSLVIKERHGRFRARHDRACVIDGIGKGATEEDTMKPGETRTEPDPSPGLEDPRTIHPSPERIFRERGKLPSAESPEPGPSDRGEDTESGDADRGIIDPRNETIGPDI